MDEHRTKMSLIQLTVIVAVNMMGSGIIMLPANMAQDGAISLLSWVVTAVGSMAIAYGFAQAGLLNQRAGGMSAYAEEAYGKSGFFLVFYLYFRSEEHTSELQSHHDLVCRLLLEKKKKKCQ